MIPSSLAPTIYLDPEEAERQKDRRTRYIDIWLILRVRVAGFGFMIILVALHQRFILDAFSWSELTRVALILVSYSLAAREVAGPLPFAGPHRDSTRHWFSSLGERVLYSCAVA
jgi:hypothetical protein